ncbi:tRNA 2-thiouridine(34) synthase MnmA [Patescibacteria group bacterium]|nr:tRNA 2-thiouridine(34) synthase MnmA [Patescibacteria group bacterium]
MKIAVGLSGGVDSAVSALLLKRQGYEVVGVYLHCWNNDSSGCGADEDKKSALKTALEIGIPFKILDFSKEYMSRVIDYFYREYRAGRTPNPDVMCNSEIKFGLFLEWAMENDFDYVATGHYARLDSGQGRMTKLMIPKDKHKDQTYFLWKLGQKELKKVLFPLGDCLKSEVRSMAKKAKLSVADRKDSQGICFVGKVDVRDFLKKRLKVKKGDVLDKKGNKIGGHDGAWFYTIGQRGGWNITVKFKDPIPPLYIVEKDVKKNLLVVGESKDAKRKSFKVGELSWVGGDDWGRLRTRLRRAKVRIRHGGELVPVSVSNVKGRTLDIEMGGGQRGVAAGQSAVFYSDDGECLGGGVII